jgi:serine/threonine-protein kinase
MSEPQVRRIGDYEVLGVLGSGGMGQVFKVRNVISDRIEAMKVILPDLAGRQDLADRFLREIKLLASLDHPNIAALRTALTIDNQLVMIMEYVEGMTVAAKLEHGPLMVPDAVNYIDQTLGALAYAHQRKVIHRDIKPSNMMVASGGVVKLMDFGIARSTEGSDLTATGAALGSLYYMPPEQVKGQPTDARSDLYSVGASLYEMVTGERPFKADSSYSLMAAQVQQSPKAPIELRANLPSALNEIILLAMAKEPSQRFQSAEAFRNAVNSVPAATVNAAATAVRAAAARTATMAAFPARPASAGASQQPVSPLDQPIPAPQPAPSVIEMARSQSTGRGKYVALGGLLVAAILVAAGLNLPRLSKARAGVAATPVQQNVATPAAATPQPDATSAPQAAESSSATSPPTDTAVGTSSATSGPALAATPAATAASADQTVHAIGEQVKQAGTRARIVAGSQAQNLASEPPPLENSAAPPPRSPSDNPAALAEVEEQVDHMSARTAAVNDSLDNLRRQQQAQGVGLRGDITASQERLRIHLGKAQAALQGRDLEGARKHATQAEAELEQLERFLGR